MRKRKSWISVLLVIAMVCSMVLTGCSSSKDKKTTSDNTGVAKDDAGDTTGEVSKDVPWDTNKKDTIVLTVINNFYTAGEKKLAEDYMKLHPETEVVVDVVSDNDAYVTKMQTSLSGDKKNAPDIVHGNFAANVFGGSIAVGTDKGYFYDMTNMLDETNPYNDGKKVKDVFEEADLVLARNNSGGTTLGFLPFDKCGISFFYNKTIFDKLGLEAPNTYEGLVKVCETLKENGYDAPISAGAESEWLINFLADACYRKAEDQFLIMPGDGLYDENTMSANANFKFDENNLDCDAFVVDSLEKQAIYAKENGVNTKENKQIWTLFQNLAIYFTQNWIAAEGSQVISDFESQNSPILLNGSWNAGLILSDIAQLPAEDQFDWATFNIQSFENTPEGFSQKIRGLYVLGNAMSIIQKDDNDHMERVKDFYKFWYSPTQAKICYEETLSNGNYVQGPSVIKGVELDADLNAKLEGFIATGNVRTWSWASGQTRTLQADKPMYNDLISRLSEGSLDVDSFLEQLDPIYNTYNEDGIGSAGFDLDPATADTAR